MAQLIDNTDMTIDQELIVKQKRERNIPTYIRFTAIVAWIWSAIFLLVSWNLRSDAAEAVGIYELDEVGGVIYENWLIQTVVFYSCIAMIVCAGLLYWLGLWGVPAFMASLVGFVFMPVYSGFFSPVHAMKTNMEVGMYVLIPTILFFIALGYLIATVVRRA
jgi:hypothetical protein